MFNRSLLPCPCCGFETLSERGEYEICRVCWWEDDGQNDTNADQILGGPNGRYSLTDARNNFRDHGYMYDLEDAIEIVKHPSAERRTLINYCLSVVRGEEKLDKTLFESLRLSDEIAQELD
ncbi:MAG: hypothetical protein CMK09_11820 [Ponticaulis sp.]|nr:hypothetical protein [Ponticaulis sp.]